MAARDDTYRNQRLLDIVFAVSSIVMLLSLLWMFGKDHYRPFKEVQRRGRDVEVAVLSAQATEASERHHEALTAAEAEVQRQQVALASSSAAGAIKQLQKGINERLPKLTDLEGALARAKATRTALVSQRDLMVEQRGLDLRTAGRTALDKEIARKEHELTEHDRMLAQLERDVEQLRKDQGDDRAKIAGLQANLTKAETERDRLNREQGRLRRTAEQKQIGLGAKFRALPVIDAFNSPYRIQQHLPDGLLIDYNFKRVQREDRCVTCHIHIDRATPAEYRVGYDKDSLRNLADLKLTTSEIAVYSAHPRLDLFVGSTSPHALEKFACTICHSGHGGSATFNFAYHFPDRGQTDGATLENYTAKKQRWEDDHHWHADLHPDYLWDFPMLPQRFIESTCVKCHHQITDLIRTDGREEAPKLLKGYRLVRDLGCFGCHEISGFKSGRAVGPDLRLEPYPAVADLSPLDRSRLLADPNDPPGQLRKVGPGLRRIAEKTTEEWTRKWIRSPRSFRPETRMPHFFGLTNNHPAHLSDQQPDKETQLPPEHLAFPDAEIQAVTFYLFKESEQYLSKLNELQGMASARWDEEQQLRQLLLRLDEERRENPQRVPRGTAEELPADLLPAALLERLKAGAAALREKLSKDQLAMLLGFLAERERQHRAATAFAQLAYPPAELKAADGKSEHKPDANIGKQLFQTRGCLACHSHDTVKVYNAQNELISKQEYGPNLSNLKAKLGNDRMKAEKWLYYWLTEPGAYHPRTKMPNPQLEPRQRADIAAWLMSDDGSLAPPKEWDAVQVGKGDVKNLARVFLDKALMKTKAAQAVKEGLSKEDVSLLRLDADERILVNEKVDGSPFAMLKDHAERLQYYVGRKTISRYGCYACHDIPGFETAKPIGTPLNDWGKKDSERLAFENILDYVKEHHKAGHHGSSSGDAQADHAAYEPFFFEALEAQRRDGFLHQKLLEPRSYDYEKLRAWDDRLRMPQFRFAHAQQKQGESDENFAQRAAQEEAEAVEAVMTFILGLVAEPIPPKFVNQPAPDRLNEVKGIKVLEQFNCIGCHVLKAGSYEFALEAKVDDASMREQLQSYRRSKKEDLQRDPGFPEHNAWRTQRPYPPGRVIARGTPYITNPLQDEEGPKTVTVELWEAVRFPDDQGEVLQFPVGLNQLQVPINPAWQQRGPYGGTFAEVLVRILAARDRKELVGDRGTLLAAVPPALIREGQKVQAQWLLEFLLHPHEIRPPVAANMRMPRFNLSQEEAETLVKYFIAVDRLENPALGLEYLGQRPPQRDAAFQAAQRQAYADRLREMLPQADATKTDYFEVGWQLLTDRNLCSKCHDIGGLKAEGKPEEKGPDLQQSAERLRPDFIERWVSLPRRLVPYTAMVQYDPFYAQGASYHSYQNGLRTPLVRQTLQLAPLFAAPVGQGFAWPMDDRLYNQILRDYALTPEQKVRAVRDALMSWGYLANPPPSARTAGQRGDMHSGEKHP